MRVTSTCEHSHACGNPATHQVTVSYARRPGKPASYCLPATQDTIKKYLNDLKRQVRVIALELVPSIIHLADIPDRLAELSTLAKTRPDDHSTLHAKEDALHRDVLHTIAHANKYEDRKDLQDMATLALLTLNLNFPRASQADASSSQAEDLLKIAHETANEAERRLEAARALQASWVSEGVPPIGTSVNRWWDRKLAELAAALGPVPRKD